MISGSTLYIHGSTSSLIRPRNGVGAVVVVHVLKGKGKALDFNT